MTIYLPEEIVRDAAGVNSRYVANRTDRLRAGRLAHLALGVV